ncbi:alpha/beta hydrolase [Paracoccaceae bacterium GXU_MW_L88]
MFLRVFLTLVVVAIILLLFGPRHPVQNFPAHAEFDDPEAVVAAQEAAFDDIRPGLNAAIYRQSEGKTPLAFVYLHGFSASPAELAPVPQDLAARFGANLYIPRLTGHGRTGDALGEAKASDWIKDAAEAIDIGSALGEQVVVIGTSTGGTLAALAALDPETRDEIAGVIFISPNFRLMAKGEFILTLPFASQIVPLILGETRSFEPHNPAHEAGWTSSYPSRAIVPMAALVKKARNSDYNAAAQPALFLFDPADSVVSAEETRAVASEWGGPAQIAEVALGPDDDPSHHVLAGDALSPSQNAAVTDLMTNWLVETGLAPAP